TVTCVVQVAGKLRDKFDVSVDVTEDELRERALASDAVPHALGDRPVRTVVVRAPRLVNVVPGWPSPHASRPGMCTCRRRALGSPHPAGSVRRAGDRLLSVARWPLLLFLILRCPGSWRS